MAEKKSPSPTRSLGALSLAPVARGAPRSVSRSGKRRLARHAQRLLDGAVHELGPQLDGPVGRVVGHHPTAQPVARLEHQHAHARRGQSRAPRSAPRPRPR